MNIFDSRVKKASLPKTCPLNLLEDVQGLTTQSTNTKQIPVGLRPVSFFSFIGDWRFREGKQFNLICRIKTIFSSNKSVCGLLLRHLNVRNYKSRPCLLLLIFQVVESRWLVLSSQILFVMSYKTESILKFWLLRKHKSDGINRDFMIIYVICSSLEY